MKPYTQPRSSTSDTLTRSAFTRTAFTRSLFKRSTLTLLLCTCLLGLFTASDSPNVVTIFTIGDSTCANKSLTNGNLERGWGQALSSYFDSRYVVVDNHAVNGRSTLSFRNEGRWQVVLERIKPGDYVLIQFGHNDQKPNPDRHTDPGTTYNDQLKQYVEETRAKGGHPVLLTSIIRRHFDAQGLLVDTHGAYIQAVKDVAAALDVPLIDHNRSSHELVQQLGPEASKRLFMWVEKGSNPAAPEGKQDDTHLRAAGARVMARMVAEALVAHHQDLAPHVRYYDLVVAKDGSGDFMTVQEAINAVPVNRAKRTTLFIRKGVYAEKLQVPASCSNLTLVGESVTETILTYADYAAKPTVFGENTGTFGSGSLYIYGQGFEAINLTFANEAGPVGQAVAVVVAADKVAFKGCRFLGFQDTLYTWGKPSRQYYEDCYIEGTVDFIFGSSTALFNRCEIRSKRSGGYLTAASTPEGTPYGYVFLDCRLTADEGVEGVYLGRPWRPFAKTVFIRCYMGAHIRPEGWHTWNKPDVGKTAFYAEQASRGPGANPTARVSWAHQLSDQEAAAMTPATVLNGADGWAPWESLASLTR